MRLNPKEQEKLMVQNGRDCFRAARKSRARRACGRGGRRPPKGLKKFSRKNFFTR
mgnify:CR=1 FL=1